MTGKQGRGTRTEIQRGINEYKNNKDKDYLHDRYGDANNHNNNQPNYYDYYNNKDTLVTGNDAQNSDYWAP